jgi:hypothetical protein
MKKTVCTILTVAPFVILMSLFFLEDAHRRSQNVPVGSRIEIYGHEAVVVRGIAYGPSTAYSEYVVRIIDADPMYEMTVDESEVEQ